MWPNSGQWDRKGSLLGASGKSPSLHFTSIERAFWMLVCEGVMPGAVATVLQLWGDKFEVKKKLKDNRVKRWKALFPRLPYVAKGILQMWLWILILTQATGLTLELLISVILLEYPLWFNPLRASLVFYYWQQRHTPILLLQPSAVLHSAQHRMESLSLTHKACA